MLHRLKKSLILLLKVCVFGVVLLGGLELFLRYKFNTLHSQKLPQKIIDQHTAGQFRYDVDLMWYWKDLPHPNNGINAVGFRRNKSMQISKPDHVIRVIALGDSQTYGGGIKTEQTFSHVAEEALGEHWEILNAGISGYRSLNIFRLLRLKMLRFEPDIILVNTMLQDSPRENGDLHQKVQASPKHFIRETLWNSRLYYLSQMLLRRLGWRVWEDLPWPVHLQKVRDTPEGHPQIDGYGNQQLIADWAKTRGILAVFMEYQTQTQRGTYNCLSRSVDLPKPTFEVCRLLEESQLESNRIFIDTNHYTAFGASVIGEALARELPQLWEQHQSQR